MKTIIATLLLATAAAFSQEQQPTQQPQPQDRKKQGEARRATMKKLQTDLDQAASRAKFTDEQRKQWDEARQALRQQSQQRGGRRNRVAPDTASNAGSAREALKTLRSLTSSEAFQPEDRDLLKKDFDALRKSGGRGRQGSKTNRKSAA